MGTLGREGEVLEAGEDGWGGFGKAPVPALPEFVLPLATGGAVVEHVTVRRAQGGSPPQPLAMMPVAARFQHCRVSFCLSKQGKLQARTHVLYFTADRRGREDGSG